MPTKPRKNPLAKAWREAVKQRAFRTEDAPEFVIDAVRRAEMDSRHGHLNELMPVLMFKARMSTRGTVTIPREIRRRLNIKPGSQVDFVPCQGGLEMVVRNVAKRSRKSRP